MTKINGFAIAFTALAACAQASTDETLASMRELDVESVAALESELSQLTACHVYDTHCWDRGFTDANLIETSGYLRCGPSFCDGECGKLGNAVGIYSPREYSKLYVRGEEACWQYFQAPALPVGCGCRF